MAAHLGIIATRLAHTRFPGRGSSADSCANPRIHIGRIRGHCAARVPGIIFSAQDSAGDCDHFREFAHHPAEDWTGGYSRGDSHVPLQLL